VKYSNDYLRYLNPDPAQMYIDNTFRQQEIYASAAAKYALLPQIDINLAADYLHNNLDANLPRFVYPVRNTFLTAASLSAEVWRINVMASMLGTFVFDKTSPPNLLSTGRGGVAADDKQRYTPAVFISYAPFDGAPLHLRAFYKQIFRMPTFNDLYYTEIGNIALQPEFAVQYNVGIRYAPALHSVIRRLSLSADVYFNKIENKIIAVPRGSGQYRWMMMNVGNVEIRGLDVSARMGWSVGVRHTLPLQIDVGLNYTYQQAQDFTNPDNASTYGGQIAYIPRHSGSATAGMEWQEWDMNYSFIYAGERYRSSANIPADYVPSWYTHDLRLSKTFHFARFAMRISAEINNLLDQQYEVISNYPMPGRNYRVAVKFII
jgi:outer membrane cobalamin receptor